MRQLTRNEIFVIEVKSISLTVVLLYYLALGYRRVSNLRHNTPHVTNCDVTIPHVINNMLMFPALRNSCLDMVSYWLNLISDHSIGHSMVKW